MGMRAGGHWATDSPWLVKVDKDRQWAKNQQQHQPEPDFLTGNIHRFDLLLIFFFFCKVVEIQVCGITEFYTWKSEQETEWARIFMDQGALRGAHKLQGRGKGNLPASPPCSPNATVLETVGSQGSQWFTSTLDVRGGMTSVAM